VTPASFAAVAATAVLGSRLALARVHVVPDVALALAVGTWVLTWLGIRRSRDFGAASGTRLLVVVATQSLVVLTTVCARWAAPAALVVVAAGAALHPAVLVRLPPRERRDSPGDVWIVMGAIAITTLAAARLSLVTARRPMEVVAVILWALATAMLPVLVAAEVRWPRLRFHPKRWATVFPLGMYAAASVTVAHTTHLAALTVARVAFWAAVVVAVAAAAGAGHAALRVRAHR
jgi:tellurite resistance protein TehA-like permease